MSRKQKAESRKQKAESKKQKAMVAEIKADFVQHRIPLIPLISLITLIFTFLIIKQFKRSAYANLRSSFKSCKITKQNQCNQGNPVLDKIRFNLRYNSFLLSAQQLLNLALGQHHEFLPEAFFRENIMHLYQAGP